MIRKTVRRALEKELEGADKAERRLAREALRESRTTDWKGKLEEKVPPKVYAALESAFCKAFTLVFQKGTGLIEKSYNREKLQQAYAARDQAVWVKRDRQALGQFRGKSRAANARDLLLTTAEGVGLGVLGVGLPDIVLFVSLLLKGIYETALRYGFDYDTPGERLLILKMMEASLAKGTRWQSLNQEVEHRLTEKPPEPTREELEGQIRQTAQAFAMDMLVLKFVQGLPLVGVLGGAGNPVYYRRVMKYVQLKYHRRYLNQRKKGIRTP